MDTFDDEVMDWEKPVGLAPEIVNRKTRAIIFTRLYFPDLTDRQILDFLFDHTRYPAYGDQEQDAGLKEDIEFYLEKTRVAMTG